MERQYTRPIDFIVYADSLLRCKVLGTLVDASIKCRKMDRWNPCLLSSTCLLCRHGGMGSKPIPCVLKLSVNCGKRNALSPRIQRGTQKVLIQSVSRVWTAEDRDMSENTSVSEYLVSKFIA